MTAPRPHTLLSRLAACLVAGPYHSARRAPVVFRKPTDVGPSTLIHHTVVMKPRVGILPDSSQAITWHHPIQALASSKTHPLHSEGMIWDQMAHLLETLP